MHPSLFLIVFLGYLIGLIFYFLNFEFEKDSWLAISRQILAATLALHAVFILLLVFHATQFSVTHLFEYVISFLILSTSFFIETRYKARNLVLFSLPITLILCVLAIILEPNTLASQLFRSSWLWLHVGLMLVGFAGLILAVSSAAMYLLQSRQLKSKHLGNIFLKLPSLDRLDKIHFFSLSVGVVLFSLGILSGLFWASNLKELGQIFKDPKVILSFVTCFMYWALLGFRLSALRRGQKIALGTVFIFALLIVTFMSSHYAPSLVS